MTLQYYNRGRLRIAQGLDITGVALQAILILDGVTFDPEHNQLSDVSGSEYSGTGYSTGGAAVALAGRTVAENDDATAALVTLPNIEYTISNGQPIVGAVVVYINDGSDDLLFWDTIAWQPDGETLVLFSDPAVGTYDIS